MRTLLCIAVMAAAIPVHYAAAQSLYSVSLDTKRLHGSSGTLVLDITSNKPLTNRVDVINFVTDGEVGLPQTQGTLVAGDLIQNSNAYPAKFTRMRAYGFFTELALPFTAFGDSITFGVNVSETGPTTGEPADQFSVFVLDQNGHSAGRGYRNDVPPVMAITITGERGGKLELLRRAQTGTTENTASGNETEAMSRLDPAVAVSVTPAWAPLDPTVYQTARTFEGNLTEFCNRRCDGKVTCTGGAFAITVDDNVYSFDDIGNLKAQVALVDNGKNPLTEGQVGHAKVVGNLNGSTLSVLDITVN